MAATGSRPHGPDTDLARTVADWIDHDPDEVTRHELQELVTAGAWDELAARFAGRLHFGTAGLRAALGAGPLRMNRLVVRQAAAGLVRYLQERGRAEPLVVIGFDARTNSDRFAVDSAAVVAAAGGRALVFDRPGPTPLLAFAVRHLGADAGVMVTASHNPRSDNGYKVYLGDGAQIVPPADEEIAACIAAAGLDVPVAPPGHHAVSPVPGDVEHAYLAAVTGRLDPAARRDVRITYTALHGVGAALAERAFAAAGFPPLHVVDGQHRPDPAFPTVAFPNPEEPGALDAALALAASVDADVLLAHDPDADRLGVAVPDPATPTGWRVLTGNEIGVLLADHLLRHRPAVGERLVVTTVVSSRLLSRLAAFHGVHYAETLTGFKWVVRPALEHPEWDFVMGYEEALGFSVGGPVRDKDGIAAGVVFAELVAQLGREGRTVPGRLEDLARQFGLHTTVGFSHRFEDVAAATAVMDRLRAAPPVSVGGRAVIETEDLALRPAPGATDALRWELDDGSRVLLRPSGTEPKLKVYLERVESVPAERAYDVVVAEAGDRLARLRAALESSIAAPPGPGAPAA